MWNGKISSENILNFWYHACDFICELGIWMEKPSDEDISFVVKFEKKDFQIGTSKVKLPNWLLTRHFMKFLVFNLILHVISCIKATFINFNLDPCMLIIQYFYTSFSST